MSTKKPFFYKCPICNKSTVGSKYLSISFNEEGKLPEDFLEMECLYCEKKFEKTENESKHQFLPFLWLVAKLPYYIIEEKISLLLKNKKE